MASPIKPPTALKSLSNRCEAVYKSRFLFYQGKTRCNTVVLREVLTQIGRKYRFINHIVFDSFRLYQYFTRKHTKVNRNITLLYIYVAEYGEMVAVRFECALGQGGMERDFRIAESKNMVNRGLLFQGVFTV